LDDWFIENSLDGAVDFLDFSCQVADEIDLPSTRRVCLFLSSLIFHLEEQASHFIDLSVGILIQFGIEVG